MVSYQNTLKGSYVSYCIQAIVNNYPPLLFLVFQRSFDLSLAMLTGLITLNFAVQLVTDFICIWWVDRLGYRRAMVMAHSFVFVGLICMATLPFLLPIPYIGLIVATLFNGIGGGLIEVVVSPVVEAIPKGRKASSMSFLHSCYCWGAVLAIVVSTIFFSLFGIENWPILTFVWALVPLLNGLWFIRLPIATLPQQGKDAMVPYKLFLQQGFILFVLMMVMAGASEQAMIQWTSLFVEAGLNVSKTVGDLLGSCSFLVLMGVARVLFGMKKNLDHIEKMLFMTSLLCVFSYCLVVFAPNPVLSLIGCGICGFSVGIMWPASLSLSSLNFPKGGAGMFAILALAGDLGCSLGPSVVGFVSDWVLQKKNAFLPFWDTAVLETQALKNGLFTAGIFPLVLIVCTIFLSRHKKKGTSSKEELPKC